MDAVHIIHFAKIQTSILLLNSSLFMYLTMYILPRRPFSATTTRSIHQPVSHQCTIATLVQTENVVWCETVAQQRELSYTLIIQECLCIYILKCSWAGLVCLQITLPPATGLVVTYEVKEIKAQFTRSEVSCGQILDHECIEWTTSELNINHLELGFLELWGRQDVCLPGRLGPERRPLTQTS